MSIGDSMKKLIGIEELEDDDEITEEEVSAAKDKIAKQAPRRSVMSDTVTEKRPSAAAKSSDRRFSVANTSAFKLVLIEPKTFEECPKLVDSLKGRRPVIINLEKLETDVARKIFDFLSGATYALNGNVQKVANNIFIFAPENVDIAGGQPEEKPGYEFTRSESPSSSSPWR
jgi:cell division inhibitor SepF